MREINYSMLPEHMQDGMRLFIERGIEPGNFLYLILCNDFVHAAMRADSINQHRLLDYAAFIVNELPMAAWGSREAVKNLADSHQEKP